ncbi:leucine-rich repeat extensin-like protein 3 [Morus notabilis]|uniref:leucine-rich repeat extensin-like protein 3 n=1 Tax=Morus notabilis TaxID=981085 RepID=UPI000CECF868|nr:leucine-rich repeat extensin-like protein 3 [Morus notabilis]
MGWHRRRPWNEPEEEIQLETKNIEVDTFEVRVKEDSQPSAPPPPPSPPLSLPPSPPKEEEIRCKPKRKEESGDQRPQSNDFYKVNYYKPPPARPPPPPPPPPPVYEETEKKSSGKSQEKRRGNATKEFLTSLRKKKKKQRQNSVELSDSFLASIDYPYLPSYPPSLPPLPPPPSVFHTLFSSKKGKTKKYHSFSQSPSLPPSSPPPPPSVRVSRSKAQSRPILVTQKPSLPVHTRNVDSVEENTKIESESLLIPILMQNIAQLQGIQFKFQLGWLREHEQRSLKMYSTG